jgi:hypothetical protein
LTAFAEVQEHDISVQINVLEGRVLARYDFALPDCESEKVLVGVFIQGVFDAVPAEGMYSWEADAQVTLSSEIPEDWDPLNQGLACSRLGFGLHEELLNFDLTEAVLDLASCGETIVFLFGSLRESDSAGICVPLVDSSFPWRMQVVYQ